MDLQLQIDEGMESPPAAKTEIAPQKTSPAACLAMERAATAKHEYIDGEVLEMSGASRKHNSITGNIFAELHGQLRKTECEVYQSDMRVQVSDSNRYTYPDIVVVAGELLFVVEHVDTLLNPTVIIEILSPSTENYDRGDKFEQYCKLDSLQEYVMVAQARTHVEHYVRQEESFWALLRTSNAEEVATLESIACTLLQDIYEKVQVL